jgi:hypothetical protein
LTLSLFEELVASLERSAKTGSELPAKTEMVDKEVQAMPERIMLVSTPTTDFSSRM